MDRHTLCNQALAHLGQGPIQSFDDGTQEAQLCRTFYEPSVQSMLADHWWNFAEDCKTLARLAGPTRPDFGFVFQLPNDCVSPRYLVEGNPANMGIDITMYGPFRYGGDRIDFRVAGRRLYADVGSASLVYTRRGSGQDFPPPFADALTYLLAHRLCGGITDSEAKAKLLWQLYEETLKRARSRDSMSDTAAGFELTTLVAAHA